MPRITNWFFKSLIILSFAVAFPLSMRGAQRTTISLNGTWDIEDSREAEAVPVAWNHKAPVPGLVHSAKPAFPQVDLFDSRMLIQTRVGDGKLPKSAIVYNAAHSYLAPVTLMITGFAITSPLILSIAMIWLAHIGIDRALGYGLKYSSGFTFTHLGRIGRDAAMAD